MYPVQVWNITVLFWSLFCVGLSVGTLLVVYAFMFVNFVCDVYLLIPTCKCHKCNKYKSNSHDCLQHKYC